MSQLSISSKSSNNSRRRASIPTTKRPVVLDVVTQVCQLLQSSGVLVLDQNGTETKQLVRETQEALRLLETRVAVGQLGIKKKGGDRKEVRVAILLDHVLRQQPNAVSMDLTKVAKAMGIKGPLFQQMHGLVGNHFYELQQNKQRGRSVQKKQSIASMATKQSATNTNINGTSSSLRLSSQRQPRPKRTMNAQALLSLHQNDRNDSHYSILPDLTIRLSMYLKEPAYKVLQKITTALDEMIQYSTTQQSSQMSASERRGHEYDLTRYWPAYQAAMFYHIVTTTSGNASLVVKKSTEEESSQLKLEDLVQASSAFTYLELKEKLKYVRHWADEIRQRQSLVAITKPASAKKRGARNGDDNDTTTARSLEMSKKKSRIGSNTAATLSSSTNSLLISDLLVGETGDFFPPKDNENDRQAFLQWKSNMVEAACSEFANDEDPLQRAAHHVLQKYGLLPANNNDESKQERANL